MNDVVALEKQVKFRVRDLDAMPFVFRKLMALLNRPYPSPRELGQVIATDQSLSVRVLRMVNSAAGGVRNQVLSVPQAVALLGIDVVRSLSFCMASYDSFFSANDGHRQQLWRHSLLCALLSRGLSHRLKIGQPEEMFVAGMLHDIGKTVLMKHCPKAHRRVEMLSMHANNPLESELTVLGVTHAEVGSWACECWKLPEVLIACVRFHHNPDKAGPFREPATLVQIADYWSLKEVNPRDPELDLFDMSVLERLRLNPTIVNEMCSEAKNYLSEIESFLNEGAHAV